MPDPLSIATGAAGLISLGFKSPKLEIYNSYKGRDASIKNTLGKLEVLSGTLQALETAIRDRKFEPTEGFLVDRIEASINQCDEPIHELQDECMKLQKSLPASNWTSVKTAGRRVTYPLRESTLKRLDEDINETRQNLLLALNVLQVRDNTVIQDEIAEVKMLVGLVRDAQISAEVRDWLSAPDVVVNHHAASAKRHPGTGRWFVEGPVFRNWLNAETNSFLWLKGFAGCGKSVLCSTAIQHAFRQNRSKGDQRVAIAYFYFSFSDSSKQDESALLRSLLFQLACQLSDGQSILARLRGAYMAGPPPTVTLFDYFTDVIRRFDQVYIIIDALDESQRYGERGQVLKTITNLRDLAFSSLHLLVTSRDELDINDMLCASAAQTVTMNNTGVDEDIERFIKERFEIDMRLRAKWHSQRDRICTVLAQRAQGVFRWVECQLMALERCPRSSYHLEQCLQSLPRNLDETYERILCNIDEAFIDEARRILTLLCFSSRPMRVAEVLHAVSVDLEEPAHFDRKRLFVGVDDLHEICPGMLAFDTEGIPQTDEEAEAPVRIAHFSVQEYLESDRIRKQRASQFALSSETAHEEIALICCVYLLEDGLIKGAWDHSKLEDYPLAHFAAQFWYHHFKLSRSQNPQIKSLISTLFTRQEIFRKVLQLHDSVNNPWRNWVNFGYPDIADPIHHASFLGLEWIVEDLILTARTGNDDIAAMVNTTAGFYGNALHAACAGGWLEIVRILIRNGADVNNECAELYCHALQAASDAGSFNIVSMLIEHGADVNRQGGTHGSALRAASANGNFDIAKLLVEKGAKVNEPDGKLGNALTAAASGGHLETVEMLIKLGSDFESPDWYSSALQAASGCGHIKTAEVLLENGASMNFQSGSYDTALQASIAKLLVSEGADINAQGRAHRNRNSRKWSSNALQAALAAKRFELAKMLVENGADISLCGDNHDEMGQVLLEMGRSSDGHEVESAVP